MMGTLTIRYACGCTSTHSLPGQRDESSRYDHECSDCYRAVCAQRAQENETLSAFVAKSLERKRR